MDFFDDILGRIIPIIIVFVIFRNLLTVLSGGKRPPQQEPEEETETAEYDPEGNPLDWEQSEEEEPVPESAKSEEQQILDEFERMLRKPKEPPVYTPETAPEKPVRKEEQKVIRDEDTKVVRDDKDKVVRDEQVFVHRDDEPYHHGKGVVLHDTGEFEKDNSKIYREKPLIEEETAVKHVAVSGDRVVYRKKPAHPEMVKAIRWMEILGKPKGM